MALRLANQADMALIDADGETYDNAIRALDLLVSQLHRGIGREVARDGTPVADARATIIQVLTKHHGFPISADLLYGEVTLIEPRLRDRQELVNVYPAPPPFDPELPADGVTYHGPMWQALHELEAEKIVQRLIPGGQAHRAEFRLAALKPAPKVGSRPRRFGR